jgi:hypothetical protein
VLVAVLCAFLLKPLKATFNAHESASGHDPVFQHPARKSDELVNIVANFAYVPAKLDKMTSDPSQIDVFRDVGQASLRMSHG